MLTAGLLKRTKKKKKKKSAGRKKSAPALFLFAGAFFAFAVYAIIFMMNPKIINPSGIMPEELKDTGEVKKYRGMILKRYEYKENEVIEALRPGIKAYHKTLSVPWEIILYDFSKNAGGYVTYRKEPALENTIIFTLHLTHGKRQDAEKGIPELLRRIKMLYPDLKIRGKIVEEK